MKKGLVFLNFLLFAFSTIMAQTDTLYTISNFDNQGIRQITGINPDDGSGAAVNASYATGDATTLSAAMALADNGYLYYIPYVPSEQNNGGNFEIYSIAAYPTTSFPSSGPEPTSQLVHTGNISGVTTAIFRTMAAAPDGWIYLTFSDENDNISLAKFQPDAGGAIVANSFTVLGTIALFDKDGLPVPSAELRNGDITFDGSGNLYALINDDTPGGGGKAVIYFASADAISSMGTTLNLQEKYQVVKPASAGGGNFSEYVVGLAVTSSGNFYIAVQDDNDASQGGVYLLTRTTTDNELVISDNPISNANARDIADLATNNFPPTTILPVRYGSIKAKIVNESLVLNWTTLSETGNLRFDIEASTDGVHFAKIGSVDSKAEDGTSHTAIQYEFTKSVNGTMAVMGISILSLGFILLLFNRKNKFLMTLMIFAGIGLTATSCSKTGEQIDISNEGKLFVRIVQVDIDGKSTTSDVITAYKAD